MSLVQDGDMYIKVDSKGATRHPAWDDGPGGLVSQICIWHGSIIHGIQTTYERNGSAVLSRRHGGTEGDFEVISFSEPLTWISGHYGSWCCDPRFQSKDDAPPEFYYTVITSLKFGTGRQTYGPFGREYGMPFSFRMSTGCAGLHGRAIRDCCISSIGVYVSSKANRLIEEGGEDKKGATPEPPIPAPQVQGHDELVARMDTLQTAMDTEFSRLQVSVDQLQKSQVAIQRYDELVARMDTLQSAMDTGFSHLQESVNQFQNSQVAMDGKLDSILLKLGKSILRKG